MAAGDRGRLLYGATPAAFPDNATSPPSATGAANPDGPAQGCKPGSENEGLYARLKDSYQEHLAWNGGDPNAPPAMIVGGGEIPESNPPWPSSTWNIGGSETIGVDNMLLQRADGRAVLRKRGTELKESRFTIDGWIEPGGDVTLRIHGTIFRRAPGATLRQPIIRARYRAARPSGAYIERTPDEVQRDHFDRGGRLTGIYGTDYNTRSATAPSAIST